VSKSGLYSFFPQQATYVFNGEDLGMSLHEFLILNYDAFTSVQQEKIRSLGVGESVRGGATGTEWTLSRTS
jgi:hypothetical protein